MSKTRNCMSLYSRRDLGRLALAAVPAAGLIARPEFLFGFDAKPNSTWGGVPFGIFAPYRFGPEASDLEGALKTLAQLGVSNTELTAAVVERYLGAARHRPRRAVVATRQQKVLRPERLLVSAAYLAQFQP